MMVRFTRRAAVFGAASTLIGVGRARSDDAMTEYTEEEVVAILNDEAEPLADGTKTILPGFWFQLPESQRPQPVWPDDKNSFDCLHISHYNVSEEEFFVTPQMILKYAESCHILVDRNRKLLVGIRGCLLRGDIEAAEFADQQTIRVAKPDHLHMKCTLGVVDWDKNKIALYTGSTVPNIDLIHSQIIGKTRCNILPTGLHQHTVGLHSGKKLKQPGAFIENSPTWVHRTTKVPEYTFAKDGNIWDDMNGALPWDDIHAALLNYRKHPPFFSSAGCQVVAGGCTSQGMPFGPWAAFRVSAGLDRSPKTEEYGSKFQYLLLTGKELKLLSSGVQEITIRFGSSGKLVSDVQQALFDDVKTRSDVIAGRIDRETLGRVLRWQTENMYPPTGIMASDQLNKLGITL